jgi:hypothetical protein
MDAGIFPVVRETTPLLHFGEILVVSFERLFQSGDSFIYQEIDSDAI